MASPVFVSYRRADTRHATGRLFARLSPRYLAKADIFMDTEAIALGIDFPQRLQTGLADCQVCLVIIGPDWLDARKDDGTRRLDDPTDFVRLEVTEVLARGIDVIPVLVDGAKLPAAADLPEPMKPLATRNAIFLTHERFDDDADALAAKVLAKLGRSIDPELDLLRLLFGFNGTIPRSQFWIGVGMTLAAQVALFIALLFALGVPLQKGLFDFQSLPAQQKLLMHLSNLWSLWPIAALSWKRIRDLGHGWGLMTVVMLAWLAQAALEVGGFRAEAQVVAGICGGLTLMLGGFKGTRYIAHN